MPVVEFERGEATFTNCTVAVTSVLDYGFI
jgi:hypothetical protein